MITATQIKSTKHYKNLSVLRKVFIIKRKALRDINLGCNMSKLTTFENWLKVCSPAPDTKIIVKELLK